VLQEFLLGDHSVAMLQKLSEHLKRLAPQLDWFSNAI